MKIYVISLKNSPRRNTIKKRLEDANENFEFIDAVDKNNITQNQIDEIYDMQACQKRHGRSLVVAEIACFMSHVKTWHAISDSGTSAIVLEDDAILTDNFHAASSNLASAHTDSDIILLGHSKQKIRNQNKHYLHNPIFNKKNYSGTTTGTAFKLWTSGMVGYYITEAGANKLIESNKTIKCVADDWSYHSDNGLIVEEIRPYIVWEDFENMPSYIEAERDKMTNHRNIAITRALEPARIIRALYRNIAAHLKS